MSYGYWKLGARQQAILCDREMQGIYGSYTTSLKCNSELWLAAFTKCMTVKETEKLSLNIELSGSLILSLYIYVYKSFYCYKCTPLDIFYKSDFRDWHHCNFFITATYGSLPCCQNMATFQPQGTAGLNLKLRLFSNIDTEFYYTPSDTIKEK